PVSSAPLPSLSAPLPSLSARPHPAQFAVKSTLSYRSSHTGESPPSYSVTKFVPTPICSEVGTRGIVSGTSSSWVPPPAQLRRRGRLARLAERDVVVPAAHAGRLRARLPGAV